VSAKVGVITWLANKWNKDILKPCLPLKIEFRKFIDLVWCTFLFYQFSTLINISLNFSSIVSGTSSWGSTKTTYSQLSSYFFRLPLCSHSLAKKKEWHSYFSFFYKNEWWSALLPRSLKKRVHSIITLLKKNPNFFMNIKLLEEFWNLGFFC
jgi:hypothetical protein